MTRVLIVDDELGLRQSLTLLLRDAGYDVEAEADGRRALERTAAEPFDLILCDVRMPAGRARVPAGLPGARRRRARRHDERVRRGGRCTRGDAGRRLRLRAQADPLSDYREKGRGYRPYLDELQGIYVQLRQYMQPAGVVVLEVANLNIGGLFTPLAWDVAEQIGRVLHFEGEVIVCWDRYGYGYDHSYCLVFSVI